MEEKYEVKLALIINGKEVWTEQKELPKDVAIIAMLNLTDKLGMKKEIPLK